MSRKLKPKAGCKQTAKYAADNVCLYDWRQHQERAEIGDDLRPPRQIIPGATFMTDLNMNLHRLSHKRSFAPLEFPRNRIPRMAHPEWHTHTHTHRFHNKMEPLVTSESTRYVTHGALSHPKRDTKTKKGGANLAISSDAAGHIMTTQFCHRFSTSTGQEVDLTPTEFGLGTWDFFFFFAPLHHQLKMIHFSTASWHTTLAGSNTK